MSPHPLEPRRLRDGAERSSAPGAIEARLARQLRLLSSDGSMPRLRRQSPLCRGRRHALVRVAAVVVLALTVSGVAAATAYVVQRVWPAPSVKQSIPPTRGSQSQRRHPSAKTAKPGDVSARAPVGDVAAPTASSAAPAEAVPRAPVGALVAPAVVARAREGHGPAPRPRLSRLAASEARGTAVPHAEPGAAPPASVSAVQPSELTWPPPPSAPPATGWFPPGQRDRPSLHIPVDNVTQEATLLREALSVLRHDHDAGRSLALLDDYDRRFGRGALALEAASTRAQALLALGDQKAALQVLDHLPPATDGQLGSLRVTRGELRSLAGRCRDALLDFDAVCSAQAGAHSPDEVARALFGRASCRARLGDAVGAEKDRQRYLQEYPRGPAAKQLVSPP